MHLSRTEFAVLDFIRQHQPTASDLIHDALVNHRHYQMPVAEILELAIS